jgi:phenylpropionate dioxygenase-like ring-hydroxylating dioxygenase large terminal subunit
MQSACPGKALYTTGMFPLDRWYVAGFSWEFSDKPVARTLLGQPVVLFRADREMAALEDRCCHRLLPLSCGTIEGPRIRCGYHGLLFARDGRCAEIPGQAQIPKMACVRAYPLQERNQIVWIWMGRTPDSRPTCEAPAHPWHDDPNYQFTGEVYHYKAPYQLIHDNLLDLSHLGYVHARTIGGNAAIHVKPEMRVEDGPEWVRVVRHLRDSEPPPTYQEAWPFAGRIDRWQDIEFRISHFLIWTGGMDAGTGDLENAERGGFHMRGFHGITPETESSSLYFWTISSNRNPARPNMAEKIHRDTALTFDEDRVVIEAQYANWLRFPNAAPMGIHLDAPLNRARRIVARLSGAAAAIA